MEDVFYESPMVRVTRGIVDIQGTQYQLNQINTTEVAVRGRLGLAFLCGVVASGMVSAISKSPGLGSAALVIVFVGCAILFRQTILVMTTSSGRVTAMSGNRKTIAAVRDAIRGAQEAAAAARATG